MLQANWQLQNLCTVTIIYKTLTHRIGEDMGKFFIPEIYFIFCAERPRQYNITIGRLNKSFDYCKSHPYLLYSCYTVYPKKYAHGFIVLCFVVVMSSFIMNSHVVFIHIHQGCFAGTGAIVRLPQCQWSKPDGYGKISQCNTTTKHSKAKTVCIFLGVYCTSDIMKYNYLLISTNYRTYHHFLHWFIHAGGTQ